MSSEYAVIIEPFAERHFIKGFRKKYKTAWENTILAIREELQRIDLLIGSTSIAEIVVSSADIKIVKTEFRVVGTNESRHNSGNRCIIAVYKESHTVHVLLVYGKTDVRGSRETDWWKGMILDNYSEYKTLI